MSGSLRNRLWRYAALPPTGTWPRISEQLDNEFRAADTTLSAKLDQSAVPAPEKAWKEIESILDNERPPVAQPKVIPLLYKRLAIAVMVSGLAAATAMYLFTTGGNNAMDEPVAMVRPLRDIRIDRSEAPTIPSPAGTIGLQPIASAQAIQTAALPASLSDTTMESMPAEENDENAPAAFVSELQPISQHQPVSVPASPILDGNGNIIMDLNVVTKPDDDYISVTGPNGEQTRLSCKFLTRLSYLNDDLPVNDLNDDGIEWKDKFQQWRTKLMNENSFVPTADNFFDIFEMKDILQE